MFGIRGSVVCNLKFVVKVTALRTAESAIKSSTGWVFLDSAETLFITAKERVFAAIEVIIYDRSGSVVFKSLG